MGAGYAGLGELLLVVDDALLGNPDHHLAAVVHRLVELAEVGQKRRVEFLGEVAGGELRQEVVHRLEQVEWRFLSARSDQLGHVVGGLAEHVLDLAALLLEQPW